MKPLPFILASLALVAFSAARVQAQNQPAFITDFLGQIAHVEEQIMSLEGAMPQEKFTWRPSEGVRSVGEVYRHIAFGNYVLLQLMGIQPPAEANFSMDIKKWDTGSMDKAAIAAVMKASFDHVKASVAKMTETDLGTKIDFFGTQLTKRSALMAELSHIHEHLGQSIAYARMNGVVPPWTAAEQAKEAEKMKGK